FVYMSNLQYDKDLVYHISVHLVSCNSSLNVTSLAANTNIQDIFVIASSQCITSLLIAVSA
ncbi:hypothetical protein Bpfe_022623, partial [Biomphalaria pfeifferi]